MSLTGPGTLGLPLFAEPEPRARTTDPETSHEAAVSMSDAAASQRAEIYQHLLTVGPATADAIDLALGYRVTSAGRRLPELRDLGKVVMLEGTGLTRSGRQARLWAVRGAERTR
jgi:predicted ArsR family transcriptional regulator